MYLLNVVMKGNENLMNARYYTIFHLSVVKPKPNQLPTD